MGASIGSLKAKLDLLRSEREWIPAKNLTDIRRYNTEINKLEKSISRLETTKGSRIASNLKDAFSSIPFAGMVNPITAAGAAMFYSAKQSMSFKEGMAKINTTAQLSEVELGKLEKKLIQIGQTNKTDLATVPEGFEKILSQVGDVKTSLEILDAALKGAKGGFTDASVVSGALAQTLSIVGKENTNAKEVLDTLFAAKRVGAGEFADFANYMPGLVAGAQNMGISFKDTAGLFAYMTAKGQSAERASTLISNAFSALSKGDIQKSLEKSGVNMFYTKGELKGKMRPIEEFMGDFKAKLTSFGANDRAKSNWLESMGFVDKEAKAAIAILTGDMDTLNSTLKSTRNAVGETDKAVIASANPMQRMQELWFKMKGMAIQFGGALVTIVDPAVSLLSMTLTGIAAVMDGVGSGFNWWVEKLQQGAPLIVGITAGLTAYTAILVTSTIVTKLSYLWEKRMVYMRLLSMKTTHLLSLAQAKLNAIMLTNPYVLITAAIVAAAAAIYMLTRKTDKLSVTLGEVKNKAAEYYAEEKKGLDAVFEKLNKTNPKSKERNALVDELKRMYPGMNAQLEQELRTTTDTTNAYNELANAIKRKAMARGMEDVMAEESTKLVKLQYKSEQEKLKNAELVAEYEKKNGVGSYSKTASLVETMRLSGNGAGASLVSLFKGLPSDVSTDEQYQEKEQTDLVDKMAKWSAEFKKKNAELFGEDGKVLGVDSITDGTQSTGKSKNTFANSSLNETSDKITSGGSRPTTIIINLQKLQDYIQINTQNVKEGVQNMESQVTEALLRVLNSANQTV